MSTKAYREKNKVAAQRYSFLKSACLLWLRANQPDVFASLEKEAYKRWPSPRVKQPHVKHDYSFITSVKR